jgi:hypothetical protein
MRQKNATDLIDKVVAEARAGTDPLRVVALAVAAHASAMVAVAEAIDNVAISIGRSG